MDTQEAPLRGRQWLPLVQPYQLGLHHNSDAHLQLIWHHSAAWQPEKRQPWTHSVEQNLISMSQGPQTYVGY